MVSIESSVRRIGCAVTAAALLCFAQRFRAPTRAAFPFDFRVSMRVWPRRRRSPVGPSASGLQVTRPRCRSANRIYLPGRRHAGISRPAGLWRFRCGQSCGGLEHLADVRDFADRTYFGDANEASRNEIGFSSTAMHWAAPLKLELSRELPSKRRKNVDVLMFARRRTIRPVRDRQLWPRLLRSSLVQSGHLRFRVAKILSPSFNAPVLDQGVLHFRFPGCRLPTATNTWVRLETFRLCCSSDSNLSK